MRIAIFNCKSINTANPKHDYKIETYRFLIRKFKEVWDENSLCPCWKLTVLGLGICINIYWNRKFEPIGEINYETDIRGRNSRDWVASN